MSGTRAIPIRSQNQYLHAMSVSYIDGVTQGAIETYGEYFKSMSVPCLHHLKNRAPSMMTIRIKASRMQFFK